ncbi:MAG: hypothetical protein K2J86_05010, partial [Prevotella sp.]|nr:hypothetical protein [Prevotella sp.]
MIRLMIAMLMLSLNALAQEKTEVREFRLAGPYAVAEPVGMDSIDVNGKKFDQKSLLDGLSLAATPEGVFSGQVLPSLADSKSVGLLTYYVNNTDFVKGNIRVNGPKNYSLFVDGKACSGEVSLAPDHHTVALKFLAEPSDSDSIHVTMDMTRVVEPTINKQHPYMVHDLTDGRRVRSVSLSADGKLVLVAYQDTERGGKSRWSYEVCDVKTGRVLF